MKKFLIVALMLVAKEAMPDSWAKTFGGGNNSDWATPVEQTQDGGYIVAGCTASFGAGMEDFLVIKIEPDDSMASDCPWDACSPDTTSQSLGADCIPDTSSPTLSTSDVCTPLAAELVGFDAIGRNGYIQIVWQTEGEIDIERWILTRSIYEDSEYQEIAQLPPKGCNSYYEYDDHSVVLSTLYYYKLGELESSGNVNWYGPVKARPYGAKYSFILIQTPFKGKVRIHYEVPGWSWEDPRMVSLKILDVNGRVIKILVNERQRPGSYTIIWDAKDAHGKQVPTGIYYCYLKVADKYLTWQIPYYR